MGSPVLQRPRRSRGIRIEAVSEIDHGYGRESIRSTCPEPDADTHIKVNRHAVIVSVGPLPLTVTLYALYLSFPSDSQASLVVMRLASGTAIIWLPLFYTLTEGVFVRSTSRCAPNEYWCQDRCGSDDYGNTCCETPDGQHNLCGTGK
jgi:hypothetical protein